MTGARDTTAQQDAGLYDLSGKRVYVAGDRGMVGSAVVRRLARENCQILITSRAELDLRDQAGVRAFFNRERPDAVFLCAAKVGGIAANDSAPAEFLLDNLAIQNNVIDAAHRSDVEKLLFLGSSCIYPKLADQPMKETALLTGPLEPTNQWYAIAKIAGLMSCAALRRQYGRDFISAMPTNLYGPNDNFDLRTSHVAPALLRKAHVARREGSEQLEVWGSGAPRREFLYVDDLADALVFLMRGYSAEEIVNVGAGEDISIRDLAKTVARTVGYEGALSFDSSKPDGAPRKLLNSAKLKALGWTASTPLQEGLRLTYAWAQRHGHADRW